MGFSLSLAVIMSPEAGEQAEAAVGGVSWIYFFIISEGSKHKSKEGRQECCYYCRITSKRTSQG